MTSTPRYKITSELFAVKHQDKYVLYSPLKRLGFFVNHNVIDILNDIELLKRKNIFSETEGKIVDIFKNVGIINGIPENYNEDYNLNFAPTEVTLFLTQRCNLRCIYCYASGGETGSKIMPWSVAKAAIDYTINNAIESQDRIVGLGFHGGGEPTLAWSLLKRCVLYAKTKAKEKNLSTNINLATNGVFKKGKMDWIIENLSGINLSFDGVADIQNLHRPMANGSPTFDVVYSNIKRMDEKQFSYGIRATVSKQSSARMAEFIYFLGENTKVNNVHFEPTFVCGRCIYSNVDAPLPKDFIEGFRDALKASKQFSIGLFYSGARLYSITTRFCQAAGNSFCVTPDGYITSCYEVSSILDPRSNAFFYGHYEPSTGQFNFDFDKLSSLRARTVTNIKHCRNCFCKYHCAGDCLTRSTSGFDLLDLHGHIRCEINRELTKDQILDIITTVS